MLSLMPSSLEPHYTYLENSDEGYETVDVLGIPIGTFTRSDLTRQFQSLLEHGKRGWISYINVYTLNLACTHAWFHRYLKNSILTYCDGQGVRFGALLTGKRIKERIVFTDWIYDVCEVALRTGKGIYLLGATEEVLSKAQSVLSNRFPNLAIRGTHHGYFSDNEQVSVVQHINQSGADIVIVGMGMPRQEKWISEHSNNLRSSLILNAGSCFDFVAGTKRRCPEWMGTMGLEWLFRFIQEPRRLWQRYLIGNPLFILRMVKSLVFKIK